MHNCKTCSISTPTHVRVHYNIKKIIKHKKESGRQTDDTGENYNGGKDNRMQKAEREIRDKTSGGKEQESLTRRK
ncbi:hypothetical protein [Phocaeicola vulgatus]|uniref:hypothetical protein n=2 Tax=Phocaeicola vulgatus TaxID=821 RepID=UPI0015F2FD60|nr:hypothetical protein [Phocaeicola vulgatus]